MTDPSINAATYAENVRREMRDLPADTVADLTDGLEADIAASLADGAELPPAADYARDLMRAAGIETKVVGSVLARVERTLRPARAWLHDHFGDLAPAWWVIRGWVLVQFLGWLFIDVDSKYVFVSQWGEGTSLGVILIVVAVVASVWHARHGIGASRTVGKVVSAVLVFPFIGLVLADSHVPADHPWNYNTTPSQSCVDGVPNMLGRDVRSAVDELAKSYNVPYRVIDDATGYDLTTTAGMPDIPVHRQSPGPGELLCDGTLTLYLYVDTANGQPTVLATTTVPPLAATSTTVANQKTTTTSTP